MSALYGIMGLGALSADIGQDDDDEYISEEEFQKQLDDQEKTIYNALVSSLLQNYMINLKKFLKRRMDHMKKTSLNNEQEMAGAENTAQYM